MKSSSESIPRLAVVTGVGGAARSEAAAEAILLLGGGASTGAEDIDASAAFRFRVVGGMVTTGRVRVGEEEGRSEAGKSTSAGGLRRFEAFQVCVLGTLIGCGSLGGG